MGILQITLFGGVRVTHDNWLNEVKLTREMQSLLAYLLLQRHRAHSREVLVGVFWGEHSQENAHRALNTALWRLKRVLEPDGVPAGTYLTNAQSGEVGFNRESQYWLDVEEFEQMTRQLITSPTQKVREVDVEECETSLELYRGELLEGHYDDWALRERERMRLLYLKTLIYLMQYFKSHKSFDKAISYGQQILSLDRIREDVHREMMRIYVESGQRALAARQYAICKLALENELGISPMEETQALYMEIFPEAQKKPFQLASEGSLSFEQAIGQLREASHSMDQAREQVQHVLELFTNPHNRVVLNRGIRHGKDK
jgi:DNA-binding SARP family transcriptional activator